MSVTSNALLRHITIDACLRDTAHKYSLQDLIAACTRAVKENSKGKVKDNFSVSTRTVQLDLQMMRDKKKGYNAPIVVYEQKYYKYSDPNYSIGNANVKQTTLTPLSEIAETLERYSGMAGMESLEGAVDLIRECMENKVSGSFQKIRRSKLQKPSGGAFLDVVKDAVLHRRVLSLSYIDEKSNIREVIFYPLYMTTWMGRWYCLGYVDGKEGVQVVQTDCITSYSYAILPFPPNYRFNPDEYFADIIGVSRPAAAKEEITVSAHGIVARSLIQNPLHSSQRLTGKADDGTCTFHLGLIPNDEFFRWVYENHPFITIESPKSLADRSNDFIRNIVADLPSPAAAEPKSRKEKEKDTKKKKKQQNNVDEDLFSSLFQE
ncbi:MAG: WYL domain-containing protein [Bacteroidales bacterium]|nr:WYL domain-containing protein [Bacteroidales bacterium]MBQ1882710.1 WYL domain-containing protein [Bacteroidales bacterium]MBQ2482809.1 WYL domain-containing protein [Bacteroidales bacterium]